MLKLELLRGDTLKKLIALIIILTSLIGGYFIYQKIANDTGDNYVTIIFDIDGEQITKKVLRGDTVEAPVAPEKEGYTFVGWDNDASLDLVTKEQVYRAVYQINSYTISFKTNCDVTIDSIKYNIIIIRFFYYCNGYKYNSGSWFNRNN